VPWIERRTAELPDDPARAYSIGFAESANDADRIPSSIYCELARRHELVMTAPARTWETSRLLAKPAAFADAQVGELLFEKLAS